MIKKLRKNKDRGFVLIAVLLIISVLVTIILEFNYESRMKLHLSDNFHNASKALNYAEAGISIAMASLFFREKFKSRLKPVIAPYWLTMKAARLT
jgi:type II secretory pathway component PulK